MEAKKSQSKLMLLLKSTVLIGLATVAFNANAGGSGGCCKYKCAYTTSYVTYKWIPGYYRNCCKVPGYYVAERHCKVHYKTCYYYPRCVTYNYCNSCSNSFWFW